MFGHILRSATVPATPQPLCSLFFAVESMRDINKGRVGRHQCNLLKTILISLQLTKTRAELDSSTVAVYLKLQI